MIKKNRYTLGGFFTAYAVCTRVFPAVFLFGLGAKLLWELLRVSGAVWDRIRARFGGARWVLLAGAIALGICAALPAAYLLRERLQEMLDWNELGIPALWAALAPLGAAGALLALAGLWGLAASLIERRYLYYFASFAVTVCVLFGVSVGYCGGLDLWKEYKAKIGRHNQDISPWRVGFKYLYIARFERPPDLREAAGEILSGTKKAIAEAVAEGKNPRFANALKEPFSKLKTHTNSSFYRTSPKLWWSIQAFVLLCAVFAVRGLKDHLAFVFGFIPCFFLVAPTYYYYIMILVPFLFFASQMDRPPAHSVSPGYWSSACPATFSTTCAPGIPCGVSRRPLTAGVRRSSLCWSSTWCCWPCSSSAGGSTG